MSLDACIMLAGITVAGLQFLGFPTAWDDAIYLILGVMIIGLGVYLRRKRVEIARKERDQENNE